MATVATAAAQHVGLEVITDSPYAHGVVSCRDEEVIYRSLIHAGSHTNPSAQEMTLRLAHLVFVGGFDVTQLKPDDLAELSKNREDPHPPDSNLLRRRKPLRSIRGSCNGTMDPGFSPGKLS